MDELPAQKAIRIFGLPLLCKELERSEVQIRRWCYAKDKGGYEGFVPPKYHQPLIELARRESLPFGPEDCMPWLADAGAGEAA